MARSLGAGLHLSGRHLQSAETLTAAANSSQDAKAAMSMCSRANRLPLTPRHLVKLRADYRFSPQWQAGVAMRAVAGSLARGNENGQHQSDGVYNMGKPQCQSCAVWDLTGDAMSWLTVFGQVNSIAGRYAAAAQLETQLYRRWQFCWRVVRRWAASTR
ncbi:MAG: hypothetical protein U1E47_01665 [Rivihabitans pingtungensis]